MNELHLPDGYATLFGQTGQQPCVGAAVAGRGRYRDLEASTVDAGDSFATRPGLDMHREHHIGAFVMPERRLTSPRQRPVPSGAMKRLRNWMTNRTRMGEKSMAPVSGKRRRARSRIGPVSRNSNSAAGG